jgi:3-oxoacyl-[acyl-carrier-protein] synthase-3
MQQHFQILGTGHYLPGIGVTATEIERRANLPLGWIDGHTQVALRHECAAPETLATMARQAMSRAMENARLDWNEIDLIIDCSTSRHQPIPCNAAILQSLFHPQADGIGCMDVHGTCLGFMLGLNVANALLATGRYQCIMLVASEAPLAAANWSEPESASLLGDGAAAVVVGQRAAQPTFFFSHETYSEHAEECQVLGGGHLLPAFCYTPERDASFRFQMQGPRLFRTALKRLPPLVEQVLADTKVSRDDVLFIPHQASPHAVEAVRRRLRVQPERFINRAKTTGNLASASIPLVLDQLRREHQFPDGQPVMLLGTSAGYSQAGMLFTP